MSRSYSPTDRIAVVDVETTGLSPWRHDRIVEIAIVVTQPTALPTRNTNR